jgi:hypothetical protein
METEVLFAVCRRTRAWRARPARPVGRGAALEPCGGFFIIENTSGRKGGLMPSATGTSISLQYRAMTGAQGYGDRAACLCEGLARSDGEAVWHRRRDSGWSLLPRARSRRPLRHDLSCRTATALNQHMHPSQNMATRPNRPGPRRPRRLACRGDRRGHPRPPARYPHRRVRRHSYGNKTLCTSAGEGRV